MAMKALILAAGYATRMYPLTSDRPKALLPVAGKAILDYLLEGISHVREVETVTVVTNHKFLGPFRDWQQRLPDRARGQILDDGTTCNEGRLGAVADIRFALAQGAVDSRSEERRVGKECRARWTALHETTTRQTIC